MPPDAAGHHPHLMQGSSSCSLHVTNTIAKCTYANDWLCDMVGHWWPAQALPAVTHIWPVSSSHCTFPFLCVATFSAMLPNKDVFESDCFSVFMKTCARAQVLVIRCFAFAHVRTEDCD